MCPKGIQSHTEITGAVCELAIRPEVRRPELRPEAQNPAGGRPQTFGRPASARPLGPSERPDGSGPFKFILHFTLHFVLHFILHFILPMHFILHFNLHFILHLHFVLHYVLHFSLNFVYFYFSKHKSEVAVMGRRTQSSARA